MRKKLFLIIILALLVAGGFYFKRAATCFASSGALELPQQTEVHRGQPIALPLKMLRIAAPGCFKGLSSDSYKNVSCGYRLAPVGEWKSGDLVVKNDSATEYEVECQIPPLPDETLTSEKLEYYFEYSPWGNPAERKIGLLLIK